MTFRDVYYLLQQYGKCPQCDSIYIGNGQGTLEVDSDEGHFRRTCACGWGVTITETKPKEEKV